MTIVMKILERDTAAPLPASELDVMRQVNAPSGYDFSHRDAHGHDARGHRVTVECGGSLACR